MKRNQLKYLLKEKIKLARWHRRFFYLSTYTLWFTGAIWIFYFLTALLKGPKLVGAHPLQVLSMKAHSAAAMVFLLALGSLYEHYRRGIALRVNTQSGLTLIAINIFLASTGWMLYYVGSETLRAYASYFHWGIGALLPVGLFLHIRSGRKS